jgi:hypothetical protein
LEDPSILCPISLYIHCVANFHANSQRAKTTGFFASSSGRLMGPAEE